MDTCIAIASQTFGSKFQGLVYAQLRRHARPGQRIVECATIVASDNEAGGYLAGQHLADSGRRAPGIVTGLVRTGNDYNAVQRLRGCRRALEERGLALAEEDVFEVIDYS